jgi:Rod binding domain-containing protein
MLQPLAPSAHHNTQTALQPRLIRAAHEFEAQMMKELLKPLASGNGLNGSEDESGSAGALGEYAGEALGRALSEAGGFGIANRIVGQVSQSGISHSGNQPMAGPVTANSHLDTVMRSPK